MKNKTRTGLEVITIIIILLLLNVDVSNSYLISEANSQNLNIGIFNDIKDFAVKSAQFMISFFSIKQMGLVSAADACCEKLSSGGYCIVADQSQCDTSVNPSTGRPYDAATYTSCEATSFCQPGWCFDPDTGYCGGGSGKQKCVGDGGQWSDKSDEAQCRLGCCKLGINTDYVTERTCQVMAESLGDDTYNFDLSVSEQACKFYTEDKGACITPDNQCLARTEKDCFEQESGIDFKKNLACTDQGLETRYGYNYESHAYKGCDPEEKTNDVYWFDDHNNPEGVASNCAERAQTCGIGSSGDYECVSTSCTDSKGNQRANGESWCEYDAHIGGGTDVVGSSHWLVSCIDGELQKPIQCGGDYRVEVCAQKVVDGFSIAQCRPNLAPLCFLIDNKDECGVNPDCRWHETDIDRYFNFGVCLPQYPEGFADESKAQDVCSLASQTCTIIEAKRGFGAWRCKENCDCKKDTYEFNEKMNNLCVSLGDCGSSINYVGTGTENYGITGDWRIWLKPLANVYRSLLSMANRVGVNTPLYLRWPDEVGTYGDEFNPQGDFGTSLEERTFWQNLGIPFGIGTGAGAGVGASGLASITIGLTTFSLTIIGGIIIGAVVAAVITFFFTERTRKKSVNFQCLPWSPPLGGNDCGKCNAGDFPCTEYRCKSLGTACQLETNVYEKENPLCYNAFARDNDPPVISPHTIMSGYQFTQETATGVSIQNNNRACIRNDKPVSFSLKTNESSVCKWSLVDELYADMTEMFKESTLYSDTHSIENLPLPPHSGGNNFRMYVKCVDHAGNPNNRAYVINICVDPTPDIIPPEVIDSTPANESFIRVGATKSPLTIILNEDAECRVSNVPGVSFENMNENATACNNELDEESGYIYEWSCSTYLQNLTQAKNNVYIKCNDSSGNVNPSDILYTLYQTRDQLEINLISPLNNSVREEEVNAINPLTLEVQTTKGAYNGVAQCKWKFLEGATGEPPFAQTGGTDHKQIFNSGALGNGDYNVKVTCTDVAGNEASTLVNFKIDIDTVPPRIINVTNSTVYGTKVLTLTSDEPAFCYYNNKDCRRENVNQTNITIGFSSSGLDTTHQIDDVDSRLSYYVTCRDEFDNVNANCAIVINATEHNDGKPPEVLRIFYDTSGPGNPDGSDELKLITNENAQCYYTANTCNFNLGDAELMHRGYYSQGNGDYTKEHYAPWNPLQTYYIKCEDSWGNSNNNSCLIIVEPFKEGF